MSRYRGSFLSQRAAARGTLEVAVLLPVITLESCELVMRRLVSKFERTYSGPTVKLKYTYEQMTSKSDKRAATAALFYRKVSLHAAPSKSQLLVMLPVIKERRHAGPMIPFPLARRGTRHDAGRSFLATWLGC